MWVMKHEIDTNQQDNFGMSELGFHYIVRHGNFITVYCACFVESDSTD